MVSGTTASGKNLGIDIDSNSDGSNKWIIEDQATATFEKYLDDEIQGRPQEKTAEEQLEEQLRDIFEEKKKLQQFLQNLSLAKLSEITGDDENARSQRLLRQAHSELPIEVPLQEHPINNFIAALTAASNASLMGEVTRTSMKREIGVWAHLRNIHGAQTVGEALMVVAKGQVSKKIVAEWIDEGVVGMDSLRRAMVIAYPDLIPKVEDQRARHNARFSAQMQAILDEDE